MVRMRLGEFDPPEMNPYTKLVMLCVQLHLSTFELSPLPSYRLNVSDYIQSPAHRNLSLQAALESIVLLKNSEKNGLPISSSVTYTACVSLALKPSVSFHADLVSQLWRHCETVWNGRPWLKPTCS